MTFDPLADERVAPNVSVPRGDNGKPQIVPRGEVVPVEYDRASGLSEYLVKDVFGIKRWELRYLAQAMGRNPDLAAQAAAIHYSTGPLTGTQPISTRQANGKLLDDIVEEALGRERIKEAANAGTAVHSFVEPGAPDPLGQHPLIVNAVAEHHKLMAPFDRIGSEIFVVCDALRVAGTFDMALLSPEAPRSVCIGDTKSGKNFHQGEFEMQLAVYAHGELYFGPPDPDAWEQHSEYTDQRLTFEEAFGMPVNHYVGYIMHVPLEGKPKPRVVRLDLRRGWDLAQQAAETRDARDRLASVPMGEKVDVNALAIERMSYEFTLLMERGDRGLPLTEFREKALALHARFSHIWPVQYTDEIKRRLS